MKIKERFVNKSITFAVLLFVGLSLWLLVLLFRGLGPESSGAQIWATSYQILAWFGALCGLYFGNLWGGRKSIVGRANLAFAIGLLAQSFGQSVFSYYYYQGVEAPYPSIADIGFFGSIPVYIYGISLLAKAAGARFSFKMLSKKLQAFLIPLAILVASYYLFLRDYEFDWSQPLFIFLDFGYPFGQAIYLSMAIVAYLLTKNYLGGMMRKPVIMFIFALFMQFIADYVFLYQVSRDIYVGGLEVDYLYLIAYFSMAVSLITLGATYYKIQKS